MDDTNGGSRKRRSSLQSKHRERGFQYRYYILPLHSHNITLIEYYCMNESVNSATQSFIISMNGLRETPSLSFPPNVTRLSCNINRTAAHVHFSFFLTQDEESIIRSTNLNSNNEGQFSFVLKEMRINSNKLIQTQIYINFMHTYMMKWERGV